jgi:hypothetical protein
MKFRFHQPAGDICEETDGIGNIECWHRNTVMAGQNQQEQEDPGQVMAEKATTTRLLFQPVPSTPFSSISANPHVVTDSANFEKISIEFNSVRKQSRIVHLRICAKKSEEQIRMILHKSELLWFRPLV